MQSNATVATFQWTYQNIKESVKRRNLAEFLGLLGLKEQALHYGIGGFSLKLFRLTKSFAGKCENFAIVTDGHW